MTISVIYQVEVAWTTDLTGLFIIGTSLLGGTDVIAGDFLDFSYDDITDDVMSINITRGRSTDMSMMQQGKCTLKLRHADGKYNPENASSPLAGYLLPMKPMRVRAIHNHIVYGLFYGYIGRIESDPENYTATIEAVDFFEWMSTYSPSIGPLAGHEVGEIIEHILDSIMFTAPTMRSIDARGSTIPSWTADGGTTCIGLIQTLLQIDLGMFFMSANGVATYYNRNTVYGNRAVDATITGAISNGLRVSIEKDKIINGQYALKTGGVSAFKTNTTSRNRYGYRNGSPMTSPYFENDTMASSYASFIVAINGVPRSHTRTIELINRDDTTFVQQLSREINDKVTVTETKGHTSLTGIIQGVTHEITNGMKVHRTKYTVQKIGINVFTIGVSLLGSTDVVGY